MPYETSPTTISPSLENLLAEPGLVTSLTELLGQDIAGYFDQTSMPSPGAEVALRNPSTYANDEALADLPEHLQKFWTGLQADAELVAEQVGMDVRNWQTPETGLEKLHRYVAQGTFKTDSESRNLVAEIMARGSRLYAISAENVPGNDEYYYANTVHDMGKFLDKV